MIYMAWNGYTVKYSIDVIDDICSDPEHYRMLDFNGVINDAKVHYEYGNVSRDWYDTVVRILSEYL